MEVNVLAVKKKSLEAQRQIDMTSSIQPNHRKSGDSLPPDMRSSMTKPIKQVPLPQKPVEITNKNVLSKKALDQLNRT